MTRVVRCVVAVMLVAMVGCDDTSSRGTTSKDTSNSKPPVFSAAPGTAPPTTPDLSPSTPSEDVKLDVATPASFEAVVAAKKGKIVVVDIWATWCIPCKKAFPHLVELHKEHAKDGVVCMSIAMDIEEQHDDALKFLTEKGAKFANFRMERDAEETEKFKDLYKIKAIPVVLVYGRDGKLARKFDVDDPDHQFTYDDVKKLVGELLKK